MSPWGPWALRGLLGVLGLLGVVGITGVLRVGFRSVVSRPLGVVGALCGVQAWGSYE